MQSLPHIFVKQYGGLEVRGSYEMSGGSPPKGPHTPTRPPSPGKKPKKPKK